jgi:hypothetical protein
MVNKLENLDEALRELSLNPEEPLTDEQKRVMAIALFRNPTEGECIDVEVIGMATKSLLGNLDFVEELRKTPFADGLVFLQHLSGIYNQYQDYKLKKEAESEAA